MNRLKELRVQHGYKTQQDLAKVLFVNQTAVSQWERGVTVPSSQMLVKLSDLYGVSIDYMLGSDDNEKTPTPAGERKIEKQDLMAAFWGGDEDLSPEDMDAMWTDVENFAAFVAQQKKREKQG